MDGSSTLDVIKLLVGLLDLAGLVAMITDPCACPTRSRSSSPAWSSAGWRRCSASRRWMSRRNSCSSSSCPVSSSRPPIACGSTSSAAGSVGSRFGRPGVTLVAFAVVLHYMTGLPPSLAFIVGAIVSATDPVAVIATFKRLRVPQPFATLVDGESLLNDGTAAGRVRDRRRGVDGDGRADRRESCRFVGTLWPQCAIGLVVGSSATRLMAYADDHLIELTISVVLAYGSYLLADRVRACPGSSRRVTAASSWATSGPDRSCATPAPTPSTRSGSSSRSCSPRSCSC